MNRVAEIEHGRTMAARRLHDARVAHRQLGPDLERLDAGSVRCRGRDPVVGARNVGELPGAHEESGGRGEPARGEPDDHHVAAGNRRLLAGNRQHEGAETEIDEGADRVPRRDLLRSRSRRRQVHGARYLMPVAGSRGEVRRSRPAADIKKDLAEDLVGTLLSRGEDDRPRRLHRIGEGAVVVAAVVVLRGPFLAAVVRREARVVAAAEEQGRQRVCAPRSDGEISGVQGPQALAVRP